MYEEQKQKQNKITNVFKRVRPLKYIKKKDIVYILIIINIIIWAIAYQKTNSFYNEYLELLVVNAKEPTENATEEPQIKQEEPTRGTKEWVLWKVEQAGIDPVKVNCLVRHESNWRPEARNETVPGNIDLGLFQWSTKWQIDPGYISLGCIGNPECETYKFIEKVKNDGNFLAWHAYTRHCQWLGTDPFIN